MKVEYIGPHESVAVGRQDYIVFEKGKAVEVPEDRAHKLLKQKKFRKATSGHPPTAKEKE